MKSKLIIGWLYPELMNIYGDRGNVITLSKRAQWRDIDVEVKMLNPGFSENELKECNLLLMGGAQDKQQVIVNDDLKSKRKSLSEHIEKGVPGLYVCGGFQFLGKYYEEADGTIVDGLGIFDLYTKNPGGDSKRLIGNLAVETDFLGEQGLIGFENHGGRTFLGESVEALGHVLSGYGNNGDDETEGARYKNSFGTYMHGPILPKNPHFADYLITLALGKKYKGLMLAELDDSLENQAHDSILSKLKL